MITELRGGKFKSGFVGAFIAKLSPASSWVQQGLFNLPIRTVAAAVFGGLAARATGGSFSDGAMAAAFAHLFNAEASERLNRNAHLRRILQSALDIQQQADFASLDIVVEVKLGFGFAYEINMDRNGRIWSGLGLNYGRAVSAPVTLSVGDIQGIAYGDENYDRMVYNFLSGVEINASVATGVMVWGGTWATTSSYPAHDTSFDIGWTLGFGINSGSNYSWMWD